MAGRGRLRPDTGRCLVNGSEPRTRFSARWWTAAGEGVYDRYPRPTVGRALAEALMARTIA